MKIYPAIDLIEGKCVRLTKGCFDQKKIYDENPIAVAKKYAEVGAEYLHVVDLDGAKSSAAKQTELILKMVEQSGLRVQVGGGIRTALQVETLIKKGVDRVIIGSMAIHDPVRTRELFGSFDSQHITLAVDFRVDKEGIPRVASHGWQKEGGKSVEEVIESYLDLGLINVLCTDIDRDGMLSEPHFSLYQKWVNQYPKLEIQASGGVSSLDDLKRLKSIEVGAVIIGKALYEGKFSLEEALRC